MEIKFCPQCGCQLSSITKFCPNCGCQLGNAEAQQLMQLEPLQMEGVEENVPMGDFLTKPILYTIFFSKAFGAPAIVYAARAASMAKKGRTEEATALKGNSEGWCKASLGMGIAKYVMLTCYLVLAFI